MAGSRQVKIADEIKRILAKTLMNGLKDPRVLPFTSITGIEVTRDYSYATCYISVLGTAEQKRDCIAGLESAGGFLRSVLAKQLTLRITPQLRFVLDDSYEQGLRMDRLIDEAMAPLQELRRDSDLESEMVDE